MVEKTINPSPARRLVPCVKAVKPIGVDGVNTREQIHDELEEAIAVSEILVTDPESIQPAAQRIRGAHPT